MFYKGHQYWFVTETLDAFKITARLFPLSEKSTNFSFRNVLGDGIGQMSWPLLLLMDWLPIKLSWPFTSFHNFSSGKLAIACKSQQNSSQTKPKFVHHPPWSSTSSLPLPPSSYLWLLPVRRKPPPSMQARFVASSFPPTFGVQNVFASLGCHIWKESTYCKTKRPGLPYTSARMVRISSSSRMWPTGDLRSTLPPPRMISVGQTVATGSVLAGCLGSALARQASPTAMENGRLTGPYSPDRRSSLASRAA